jgi:hypothetical protein
MVVFLIEHLFTNPVENFCTSARLAATEWLAGMKHRLRAPNGGTTVVEAALLVITDGRCESKNQHHCGIYTQVTALRAGLMKE